MPANEVVKQTRDHLKQYTSPILIKRRIKARFGTLKQQIKVTDDDPYITEGSQKYPVPILHPNEHFDSPTKVSLKESPRAEATLT
jgi:hypothetical protein